MTYTAYFPYVDQKPVVYYCVWSLELSDGSMVTVSTKSIDSSTPVYPGQGGSHGGVCLPVSGEYFGDYTWEPGDPDNFGGVPRYVCSEAEEIVQTTQLYCDNIT